MLLMIITVMLNFLLVKCSVGQFLPNSREAYEAKEAEQMDGLHFDDFTLSFTKLIMSVNLSTGSTASFSYISAAHLFIFLYVCCGQTQAEAHYKGHKHARKLKALETQRNRQKRGRSPSKLSKDKDQDMMMLGGATASSASHLKDITGASTFSQPGHQQMSPQICPGRQISDSPSDSHPLEAGTTATSCAPCSEPQENPTGGQQEVEEAQEPKSCKKHLHCPTCKVTVNSSLQLEAHCSGSRHKQMLDGGPKGTRSQCRVKLKPSSKPACRMKQRVCSRSRVGLSVSRQPFHCEMCQVSVNSETQLKQHMNSRRHKERLAGKPVKVKLAPFNKLQPSAALVTKLALQKHLYKALPAGFLTSPLNAAAFCTVASGPMALRLPPSPTSIIQSPFISPTLFRPAPGPLRATHTPIIFSPY